MIASGCSNIDEPLQKITKDTSSAISQKITVEEALHIANIAVGNITTRNISNEMINTDYIISNEDKTRSNTKSDTLAYVINYPDNGGFAIIASTRNVYPILAFSHSGYFDTSQDAVSNEFTKHIEPFIQEAETSKIYEVSHKDFDACKFQLPVIGISLHQDAPWNKYVVKEHPDCPVGCVAVATATVMCYSKPEVKYHGVTYPLKEIVRAIEDAPTLELRPLNSGIISGTLLIYTCAQAKDSLAKIMYWIGKDVDMIYDKDGSSATSTKAFSLCCSLGYEIPSGYQDYDFDRIFNYLRQDYMIYLRGRDDEVGGHAWVSHGYRYCIDPDDPSKIINKYIYCDWGQGGASNGYFNGNVFNALGYNFKPLKYFALKREY